MRNRFLSLLTASLIFITPLKADDCVETCSTGCNDNTFLGAKVYRECCVAPNYVPAIALGAIVIAVLVLVSFDDNEQGHAHSHSHAHQ